MQLKYEKTMNKEIITIELETCNFTSKENKLLDEFGEPIINFNKTYFGSFPVSIEKRIRTGFKVKVKFDGKENCQKAAEAANEFFEEIQEVLANSLSDLMDKASDSDFKTGTGLLSIKY